MILIESLYFDCVFFIRQLDDRRIDAETKIVSLQVSNKSLGERYNLEKQLNMKFKVCY